MTCLGYRDTVTTIQDIPQTTSLSFPHTTWYFLNINQDTSWEFLLFQFLPEDLKKSRRQNVSRQDLKTWLVNGLSTQWRKISCGGMFDSHPLNTIEQCHINIYCLHFGHHSVLSVVHTSNFPKFYVLFFFYPPVEELALEPSDIHYFPFFTNYFVNCMGMTHNTLLRFKFDACSFLVAISVCNTRPPWVRLRPLTRRVF